MKILKLEFEHDGKRYRAVNKFSKNCVRYGDIKMRIYGFDVDYFEIKSFNEIKKRGKK